MRVKKIVKQGSISPLTTGIDEESPIAGGITRSTKSYKKGKTNAELAKELSDAVGLYAAGESGSKVLEAVKRQEKKNKRGEDSLKHWKNIEPLLRDAVAKNGGNLPAAKELRKQGYVGVVDAIVLYHGGFPKVRAKLGLALLRREGAGSLSKWGNIEPLIRDIIEQNNGKLPPSRWFDDNGYSCVSAAIYLYHGGFPEVRKRLGLAKVRSKPKRDEHSLRHWKNLKSVLKEIIAMNEGSLPSAIWMGKNGFNEVPAAIRKYHGGIQAVRERLGLKSPVKWGKDSLRHWKNVEPIIGDIVRKYGNIPSVHFLEDNGYGVVRNAIRRHHGGFAAVRKKLGLTSLLRTGKDSLRHWENIEPILCEIISKNSGMLPSGKWLEKNGYVAVSKAITYHHGGYPAVREKLRGLGVLKDRITDADAAAGLREAIQDYVQA